MITKGVAMAAKHGDVFYASIKPGYEYRTQRIVRARVNGKCQTWKTRPEEFRLPMKMGLRGCFDISHRNAHNWSTTEAGVFIEGD